MLTKRFACVLERNTRCLPQGWDQGIAGMCVGEKRKLRIPASLGYGESGSPPKIPGDSRLSLSD